jgi:hypothetical protein
VRGGKLCVTQLTPTAGTAHRAVRRGVHTARRSDDQTRIIPSELPFSLSDRPLSSLSALREDRMCLVGNATRTALRVRPVLYTVKTRRHWQIADVPKRGSIV